MNDKHKRVEWQRYLPEEMRTAPIRRLVFPGSHDTGAYKLERVKLTTTGWPFWANKFSWIPKVKKFLKRWTLCHDLDIYQQLCLGIRRLDFRLAFSEKEGEFYLVHTFACVTVKSALEQINLFLHEHPYEVLYIHARRDFESGSTMKNKEEECINFIVKELKKYLVKPNSDNIIDDRYTLESCYLSQKRVFFYYTKKINENVWRGSAKDLRRFTPQLDKKLVYIEEYLDSLENGRDEKYLYCLSLTLTPDDQIVRSSIPKSLFCCCLASNGSIKNLTREIHSVSPSIMSSRENSGIDKLDILNFDFPTEKLIDIVIDINKRRFKL